MKDISSKKAKNLLKKFDTSYNDDKYYIESGKVFVYNKDKKAYICKFGTLALSLCKNSYDFEMLLNNENSKNLSD